MRQIGHSKIGVFDFESQWMMERLESRKCTLADIGLAPAIQKTQSEDKTITLWGTKLYIGKDNLSSNSLKSL